MNLKIQISEDGIPEISIGFDQDTSESEPYMVLQAHGFSSVDEVAGTLMDVAQSLHNNVPVASEVIDTYDMYPTEHRLGERSAEGEAMMDRLKAEQRPGESILQTERRLLKRQQSEHVPFNPKPKEQSR